MRVDDVIFSRTFVGGHLGWATKGRGQANSEQARLLIQLTDAQKVSLGVVLYNHQLEHPVGSHLETCDVVTFWTWTSDQLVDLEQNFQRAEGLAPSPRKILGCYMYDYGSRKPMPVDLMQHQCEIGLQWLRDGRIDGMIFLASCICDLELETVEWTRGWIQEVGDTPL